MSSPYIDVFASNFGFGACPKGYAEVPENIRAPRGRKCLKKGGVAARRVLGLCKNPVKIKIGNRCVYPHGEYALGQKRQQRIKGIGPYKSFQTMKRSKPRCPRGTRYHAATRTCRTYLKCQKGYQKVRNQMLCRKKTPPRVQRKKIVLYGSNDPREDEY